MEKLFWVIDKMNVMPDNQGVIDYVYRVFFRVVAQGRAGSGETVQAEIATTWVLDPEDVHKSNDHTPYDDLTEKEVIEWVQQTMGEWHVNNLEGMVSKQFAQKVIDAGTVNKPLPWNANKDTP